MPVHERGHTWAFRGQRPDLGVPGQGTLQPREGQTPTAGWGGSGDTAVWPGSRAGSWNQGKMEAREQSPCWLHGEQDGTCFPLHPPVPGTAASPARPEGAPTATPPCSSLGSRPPLVPLPPPPGAASVQRTIAGAVGLPGRKREGRGCAPDQARGGCWRHGCGVWGPVGDLGQLRGFGVAVGLREAAGTQPTPSLGWALRAQPVWGWWEHSGTGSPWCCQALAVAPGLTITTGPAVLPDNAKEPCWAGGSWDGAHGTGQAPHPLT